MDNEIREASKNTDKEIWRKIKDDYYSPSVHITEREDIGINVGGKVIVMPIEKWHSLASDYLACSEWLPKEKDLTSEKCDITGKSVMCCIDKINYNLARHECILALLKMKWKFNP